MRNIAIILVSALCLTSCSYRLWITVDGELASPRFAVNAPRIAESHPCVRRITVVQAVAPDDVSWSVEAIGDACAPGSEIRYGVTPPGYVETAPAKALRADVLYSATAVSRGSGGKIDFVFLNGQWRIVTD